MENCFPRCFIKLSRCSEVLFSLDAEEALTAAILLHDEYRTFYLFSDQDIFYNHIRPLITAARKLHTRGWPATQILVMREIEDQLDQLSWKGETGEVMIFNLIGRHIDDPNTYSGGMIMAAWVHEMAEQRRTLHDAHERGTEAYREVLREAGINPHLRTRYEGEL